MALDKLSQNQKSPKSFVAYQMVSYNLKILLLAMYKLSYTGTHFKEYNTIIQCLQLQKYEYSQSIPRSLISTKPL